MQFLRRNPICISTRCGLKYIQVRNGSTRHKVMSAEDAVHLIKSGDTITVGGFSGQNAPEEILSALGNRFAASKNPGNLTLIFGGGPGDGLDRGINHFAQEGMLKRAIGAHYGQAPQLGALALANKIEAYNLPLGSISRMVRAAAGKLPGHVTSIGFGTLADPKLGGGKVYGKKYLLYKAVPINIAIIRGTTADPMGNITMERESLYVDNLIQAMAARASGGLILAQVERVATENSLRPRAVRIPGTLVDAVVVARPENHTMSYATRYSAGRASEIRAPVELAPMALDHRKIIARRALLQITTNQVVNLGEGLAAGIARVAEEEKVLGCFTLTTQPGVHGGVGSGGLDFGPARNYEALLDMNQQFDFYNGGGLDVCFLGAGQVRGAVSAKGDVNVSRVGGKLKGPGGFIDISQSTRRVNLLCSFTSGGLQTTVESGRLVIKREGVVKKFVASVPEIAFSAETALQSKQAVRYITERCVFSLSPEGLELVEIAPGIDLQTQILDQMEFAPVIRRRPRLMDTRLFSEKRMGIYELLAEVDMGRRLRYCEGSRTLYIDLHGVNVTTRDTLANIMSSIRRLFGERPELIKRTDVFVNYDGFDCREELVNEFSAQAQDVENRYYRTVRRMTSAAFARHQLATNMQLARRKYSYSEALELLQSMGHTITLQDTIALCDSLSPTERGCISAAELDRLIIDNSE